MENAFKELKVTSQFVKALNEMSITAPTEIQAKAIPPALAGQDVLGVAQTGSGKTLAYLIPCVMKIKYAQEGSPLALIMAPSKELAIQIYKVFQALTVHTDIRGVCLYGGVGKTEQIKALDEGCEVVIATPGRFLDLYSYGHVALRKVRTLVLDEADRLLEMGFIQQLRSILEVIPTKRQNLLFSATFPPKVEKMAEEFLDFPTRVEGSRSEKPVEELKHFWMRVPNFRTKLNLLLHFLERNDWNRVMVFCSTKDAANRVFGFLSRKELGEVRILHANKAQNTRIHAMEDFEEGKVRILVTTDVTSRGIDVQDVSHVVNFNVPKSSEDYLHRVGRTARIKKEGMAISFADKAEELLIKKIKKDLNEEIPEKDCPKNVEEGQFLPGEQKEIAREQDRIKQKQNPEYRGAFHKKKRKR